MGNAIFPNAPLGFRRGERKQRREVPGRRNASGRERTLAFTTRNGGFRCLSRYQDKKRSCKRIGATGGILFNARKGSFEFSV